MRWVGNSDGVNKFGRMFISDLSYSTER